MTDGYDCYQNALAERINGIIKHRFPGHKTCRYTSSQTDDQRSCYALQQPKAASVVKLSNTTNCASTKILDSIT